MIAYEGADGTAIGYVSFTIVTRVRFALCAVVKPIKIIKAEKWMLIFNIIMRYRVSEAYFMVLFYSPSYFI